MTPLRNSYAAKLIPTYGATPKAVVTSPRYSPRIPPSSRATLSVIPHIVSADAVGGDTMEEDAWRTEESVRVRVELAGGAADWAESGIDAVAIESLERTKSSGYVEPANSSVRKPTKIERQDRDQEKKRTNRCDASQGSAG
jgi:hypothetical protein